MDIVTVERLDHLGIIAGVIKDLRLYHCKRDIFPDRHPEVIPSLLPLQFSRMGELKERCLASEDRF